MEVIKCQSVPVITISMVIGSTREEGGQVQIWETDNHTGFSIYVPKRVVKAKGITVGVGLDALVVPLSDLSGAQEVLALALRKQPESRSRIDIYDKGAL